jgi:hypothetical protein
MFLTFPDLGWTSVPTSDGLSFDHHSATPVIRGKGGNSFVVLLQAKESKNRSVPRPFSDMLTRVRSAGNLFSTSTCQMCHRQYIGISAMGCSTRGEYGTP